MLTISKLAPDCHDYYERSVATALEGDDAGRGESSGVWVGRGAGSLGLTGIVSPGQLGALMRGLDPSTDEPLRRHPKARVVAQRTRRRGGERLGMPKRRAPVAGFDLVFSAPKSVSLLHALGDEGSRRAAEEAHLSAWQAAFAYLEDEACALRRGLQGRVHEHAEGFVAAAYQHRTSRAADPHVHTHVVTANLARSPCDGKWLALDGGAILRHYKRAASHLYQAHLRYELSRSLAVEWQEPVKGSADLRGMSRAVIDAFSTRGRQLAERLDEKGLATPRAAGLARLETRQPKEKLDFARLQAGWAARAAEHRLDARSLDRLVHRSRYREPTSLELARIAVRFLGPNGLAEPGAVFSEPQLVIAWAAALARGAPAERIRHLAGRFLEIDGVERVGFEATPGRPGRHSVAMLAERAEGPLQLDERWFAQRREHRVNERTGRRLAASAPGRRDLESRSDAERRIDSRRSAASSRAEVPSPPRQPSGRERQRSEPGLEL